MRPLPPPRSPHDVRRLAGAWATLLLVGALLGACAPAVEAAFAPPTFRIVSEESGLTRLDLPGFPDAGATFRLVLDVVNPNPVPLRLSALDGDVFLAGAPLAAARFVDPLDLPPRGSARVALDLRVGPEALPGLLASLADVVAGTPVDYRVDAAVRVDLLGAERHFGSVTIARGSIRQEITLRAPTLRLDAEATGVRSVSFDGVTIDLAVRVANPNVVGVVARAPEVRVRVGERDVALVQLVPGRIPAGGETTLVQRVVVNPVGLAASVVTQLQRLATGASGSVDVILSGAWELEVPGLRTLRFDAGELLRGRLE